MAKNDWLGYGTRHDWVGSTSIPINERPNVLAAQVEALEKKVGALTGVLNQSLARLEAAEDRIRKLENYFGWKSNIIRTL
jgi:hypothetical protein